jgi:rubrerythrin
MFNKDSVEKGKIEEVLRNSIEVEENQMREYLIAAERIHDDPELKERLENFAQGNAKRSKQLLDEIRGH